MDFYRYEDGRFNERDIPVVRLVKLELVRETPHGYWIQESWMEPRWVSKTARKRYAYPSQEQALHSYIARKTRQAKLLWSQVRSTEARLKLATSEYSLLKGKL